MKRLFFFLPLLTCLSPFSVCAQTVFEKTFAGTQGDEGHIIMALPDNGFIFGGSTYSFGAGQSDIFLVRTDSSGNVLWKRTFGSTQDDTCWSITRTTDNYLIGTGWTWGLGSQNSDLLVFKTDLNGQLQWSKKIGSTIRDYNSYVFATPDSGFVLFGSIGHLTAPNWPPVMGQAGTAAMMKFDSGGNLQWTSHLGTAQCHYDLSLVVPGLFGEYYATFNKFCQSSPPNYYGGSVLSKINAQGQTVWRHNIQFGSTACIKDNGNLLMAYNTGGPSFETLELDTAGAIVQGKSYGYYTGISINNILNMPGNTGYLLTGNVVPDPSTPGGPFFLRMTENGTSVWARYLQGMTDYIYYLASPSTILSPDGRIAQPGRLYTNAPPVHATLLVTDTLGQPGCAADSALTVYMNTWTTSNTVDIDPTIPNPPAFSITSVTLQVSTPVFSEGPCGNIGIPSGVENSGVPGWTIYPNPAGDVVRVSTVTSGGSILLHDCSGRLLETFPVTNTQMEIDLRSFAPGLYFFSLHDENDVVGKYKLLIAR